MGPGAWFARPDAERRRRGGSVASRGMPFDHPAGVPALAALPAADPRFRIGPPKPASPAGAVYPPVGAKVGHLWVPEPIR